jgi:predicted HicB family RNase H-like nuclease
MTKERKPVKLEVARRDPERYAYRVIWSEEDQEFVGLVAEFPSLSHLAPSQLEALNGIVALVAAVIDDLAEHGEVAPTPMSLQEFKGKIALRVPPHTHRELAMEAAEQGVSLNRLISQKLTR